MLHQYNRPPQVSLADNTRIISLPYYLKERGLQFSDSFLRAVSHFEYQAIDRFIAQSPNKQISADTVQLLNQGLMSEFEKAHRVFDNYLCELISPHREDYYYFLITQVFATIFDIPMNTPLILPVQDVQYMLMTGHYPARFKFSSDSIASIRELHQNAVVHYLRRHNLNALSEASPDVLQNLNQRLIGEFAKLTGCFNPCLERLDLKQQQACYYDMALMALEATFDVHVEHKTPDSAQSCDSSSSSESIEHKTPDSSKSCDSSESSPVIIAKHPTFEVTILQELHAEQRAKLTANHIQQKLARLNLPVSESLLEYIKNMHEKFLRFHYQNTSCKRIDLDSDNHLHAKINKFLFTLFDHTKKSFTSLNQTESDSLISHLYLIALEEVYPSKLYPFFNNTLTQEQLEGFRRRKIGIHQEFLFFALRWSLYSEWKIQPDDRWCQEVGKVYSCYLRQFIDKDRQQLNMDEARLYELIPLLNYFTRLIQLDRNMKPSKSSQLIGDNELPSYPMVQRQCVRSYKHFLMALNLLNKFSIDECPWLKDILHFANPNYVEFSITDFLKEEVKALMALDYQLHFQEDPEYNYHMLFNIIGLSFQKNQLDQAYREALELNPNEQIREKIRQLTVSYQTNMSDEPKGFFADYHRYIETSKLYGDKIKDSDYPKKDESQLNQPKTLTTM